MFEFLKKKESGSKIMADIRDKYNQFWMNYNIEPNTVLMTESLFKTLEHWLMRKITVYNETKDTETYIIGMRVVIVKEPKEIRVGLL